MRLDVSGCGFSALREDDVTLRRRCGDALDPILLVTTRGASE
jgi:hypothetical protein